MTGGAARTQAEQGSVGTEPRQGTAGGHSWPGQRSSGTLAARGCPRPRGAEPTPGRGAQHGVHTRRSRTAMLQARLPRTARGWGIPLGAGWGGLGRGCPQPPRGWPGRGCPRGSGSAGPLPPLQPLPRAEHSQHRRAFPELHCIPTLTASRRPVPALVSTS